MTVKAVGEKMTQMTQMGWVHIHITSKQIELESPGSSGFASETKYCKSEIWSWEMYFLANVN